MKKLLVVVMLLVSISPLDHILAETRTKTAPKESRGAITGVLKDKKTNKPLANVSVMLTKFIKIDKNNNKVESQLIMLNGKMPNVDTDKTGKFEFKNVPSGKYTLNSGKFGQSLNLADTAGDPLIITVGNAPIDIGVIWVTAK